MSAPQTNIETQKRRHRGPLIGMAAVAIFAVGLIAYWVVEESANGNEPDVGTSETEVTEPSSADVNAGAVPGDQPVIAPVPVPNSAAPTSSGAPGGTP